MQGRNREELPSGRVPRDDAVVPDRKVATTATQTMEEDSEQEAMPMVRVRLAGTRRGLTRPRPGCTRRQADGRPHPLQRRLETREKT